MENLEKSDDQTFQEEIDRLQDDAEPGGDAALAALWQKKKALLRRLEELT